MGVEEATANINVTFRKLGGEGLQKRRVTDVLSITTVPLSNVCLLLEILVTSLMLCTALSTLEVRTGSSTSPRVVVPGAGLAHGKKVLCWYV